MKGSGRGIGKQVLPPGLGCEVDGRTSGWLHFDHLLASRSQMSPAGFVPIKPTEECTTVHPPTCYGVPPMGLHWQQYQQYPAWHPAPAGGGCRIYPHTHGAQPQRVGKEAANKALEPTSGAVKATMSPSDALATVLADGIAWSVGSGPVNSPYFRGDLKPLHAINEYSGEWNPHDGINGPAPLAQHQQQAMRNTQFQKVEVCFDDSSSHLKYQLGADDRPPRKKSKFLETTDST
jgi:hypothetical protein